MLVVLALVLWSAATAAAQTPQRHLHAPELEDRRTANNSTDAPFIFNTLSGLLKQWPNTLHHNGHTIIPGQLAPFTLLYHARVDTEQPPSPEWFAFDPEMSFAIMVGWGDGTYMHTYRTTKPANIIYFDGMSGALGGEGWLDSQEILISGHGRSGSKEEIIWWDDYARADKLCQWGLSHGVEGFLRMNAGFELIWCDFQSPSIQLVSRLDITPPRARATPAHTHIVSDDPKALDRVPGRPPGDEGGLHWYSLSPLESTAALDWLRAASQRSIVAQPHVKLYYASLVSFYHPRLRSLAPAREGKRMREHRVWLNISVADAKSVVSEVEEVVSRGIGSGSGLDWGELALSLVEYWGDRIMQTRQILANVAGRVDRQLSANLTQALEDVRHVTYSPLVPYMDTGSMLKASVWDIFGHPEPGLAIQFPADAAPDEAALHRCTYAYTGFFSDPSLRARMTPQEELLQSSVEAVMRRLCSDFGTIFADSMDVRLDVTDSTLSAKMRSWSSRIEALVAWLDWPAWLRCEEVCARDHVCVMPMHHLGWDDDRPRKGPDDWQPRCVSVREIEGDPPVSLAGSQASFNRQQDGMSYAAEMLVGCIVHGRTRGGILRRAILNSIDRNCIADVWSIRACPR